MAASDFCLVLDPESLPLILAKANLSASSPSVFLRSTCFNLASAPKVFASVPNHDSISNPSFRFLIVDMPG